MENQTYNVIDPSIDKFKWYNLKRKELEEVGKISVTVSTFSLFEKKSNGIVFLFFFLF